MRRDGLLVAAVVGTALFGALLVFSPPLARAVFGLVLYGDAQRLGTFGEEALSYITLLHGVLGAVMIGWAAALFVLLRGRWRVAPRIAWSVVALSVGSWFVIDTLFSLAVGAWPNALLNAGFAGLFAAGLWRARPGSADR
jgi:hypothetical protein